MNRRANRNRNWDQRVESPGASRRGFALVLTVSLLTFLVLLVVTLAALVKIEFQVDQNSKDYARARQNALLGLDVALGQLQRYAGPDQAVTARAEILDSDPSTRTMDDLVSPLWTGVWDSSSTGGDPATWLVSGNEGNDPLTHEPTDALPVPAAGNDSVWMLNDTVFFDASFGDPEVDPRVYVERVPIQADNLPGLAAAEVATVGHYAYWVGDEGVKASVRSLRPLDPGLGSRQDWDQQRRPRVAYEAVLPTLVNPGASATETVLESLLSYNQLAFLDAVTRANLRRRFHDVTVLSRGVLVDTAAGGLKADLSDPASPEPETAWLQGTPSSVVDTDPANLSYHAVTYDWVGVDEGSIVPGPSAVVAPVVSEIELIIEFDFPTPAVDYLDITLRVELWNPYQVELDSVTTDLLFELRNLPNFAVTHDTGVTELDTAATINVGGGGTVSAFSFSAPGGVSIPAGQVDHLSPIIQTNLETRTSGGSFIVFGNSSLTVVPQNDGSNDLPIELWVRVGGAGSSPVFCGQIWSVPTVESTGFGTSHFWRLHYRLLDPSTFNAADPYPDPRQFSLADRAIAPGDPLDGSSQLSETAPTSLFDTATDLLNNGDQIVLFDLPVRSLHTVGLLQHLPENPVSPGDNLPIHRPGNAHGGAASDVFDRFMFSGMDFSATGTDVFSEAVLDGTGYFRAVYSESGNPPINSEVQASAASEILVDTAFNVNSTSFLAWKAALGGSPFGTAWNYRGGSGITTTTLAGSFARLAQTGSNLGVGYSADPSVNTWRQGIRELDIDGQVDELADEVVRQIKTNGPFGSIQAFAQSGALEAAIEAVGTDPDNDATTNSGDVAINSGGLPYFATTRLTQADVLGNLAPFISARSDTFLIRAYGDAFNPITETTQSRVWCEAVVQRVPDYVDDTQAPDEVAAGTNATFGRRFEIVYFRWLSPDDV